MTRVDRDARALVAAARRALGPSEEQRSRAGRRLAAALGSVPLGVGVGLGTGAAAAAGLGAHSAASGGSAAGAATLGASSGASGAAAAGVGSAAVAAATPVAAVGTSAVVAKWVVGGFLVAVSGAGAVVGTERWVHVPARPVPVLAAPPSKGPPSPTQARRSSSGEATPASAPVMAALPDLEPSHRDRSDAAAVRDLPAISEELELVRQADAALRAGKPAVALHVLREADRRFVRGELAEEREALGIVATCALDRSAGAARARRFIGIRPSSVYVETLRGSCQLGDPSQGSVLEAPAPAASPARPLQGSGRFDDIDEP